MGKANTWDRQDEETRTGASFVHCKLWKRLAVWDPLESWGNGEILNGSLSAFWFCRHRQLNRSRLKRLNISCPCIKTSENKQTFWCRVSYLHRPVPRKTLKEFAVSNWDHGVPFFPRDSKGSDTKHDITEAEYEAALFHLISFCERGTDPAWWGLNDLANIPPPVLVIKVESWSELRLFVRESGVFVPAMTWHLCANVARWTSNHIKFDPWRLVQGVPCIALR